MPDRRKRVKRKPGNRNCRRRRRIDSGLQNFAADIPAVKIVDHLYGMVEGAACYTLAYASAADGARLLLETFGGGEN